MSYGTLLVSFFFFKFPEKFGKQMTGDYFRRVLVCYIEQDNRWVKDPLLFIKTRNNMHAA